jgi:peptide/nickel transport system ATP-binding protein
MSTSLLVVRDLKTYFFTEDGITRAVDGLSFDVGHGETLGIVGESGCGKSVAALSVLRLLPERIGRTVAGSVHFDGVDLLALTEGEMRDIRGNRIAMIFQEPMTSLNPVLTIGHQIAEALRIHKGFDRSEAREHAGRMLAIVRIPDAQSRLDDYPHQFSGGMRQRAMIAMALACNPKLLIADEPTTALDVTIQAQVLKLILELKEKTGAAVILITHDLGVVAETCQRVIVMYAGRKVEEASVLELFDRPAHPYTRGLLASITRGSAGARTKRLQEIPGVVPSLKGSIAGCAFAPRCRHAIDRCHREAPVLRNINSGDRDPHLAACFLAYEVVGHDGSG